ncbi:PREDICTED: rho GTPase-activating protein 31 isoform X1 [Chinchilla lanigera]|uniref:Rho GTPase activating protein 31 n=1 Tax=Chinchilla lanigera TaxID=34839 RepID=A0A8C2VMB2_CHILA|nr:PREDICTED: rho GTPase-activating protein 31 isoform X1 [Chinchilla lanigera]
MKNKGAKQKVKRKGAASAFGCDLTEYLESSGQDVPYVLKSCAEFIETHGIVDGIYRLSGVTSNIQRLRQEFGSDQCPDLTREVYLQDIHCVGSLCKLYFRELPNPLLTYELYEKFTEAVSHCPEEVQLARIQNVIQKLPRCHYRTLEYLIRHLAHIASFSSKTNMHARNLALVWAPNLLRSRDIEAAGCNGDAAFLAVRVQQVVIEFILSHVDQIFNSSTPGSLEKDENQPIVKSLTLPALSLPMKLVSLEEAQARSLATNHPARKERRENSLPEIVAPMGALFHTVLELPDSKRKLSSKSKKWKSIFNLGRSGSDSKSKLSRNGSVFLRGQRLSGKETKGNFGRTVTTGGFFIPATKLHSTSTSSSCDLSKQEGEWGQEGMPAGAEGGFDMRGDQSQLQGAQVRAPPEQLKVFRPIEDPEIEQTAPKMLGMFYTSSDSPGKSVFSSSLFQTEPSPHHQRKALNISEPFAVSVPLRVSAVISTNSTPCRTPPKELQSLSSLEEFSFQGSESGSWPEEEKTLGPETSTAPVAKNATSEDASPHPDGQVMVGCSQSLSLEPVAQLEEKKTSEPDLASQHSRESEKSTKLEKAEEEEQGAGLVGAAAPPESPGARAEAVFLREMDDDELTSPLFWPEIQQELKIIESEEELSLSQPPAQISPAQAALEPSPASCPSPEAPGNLSCGSTPTSVSAPLEAWTRDSTNHDTQGAAMEVSREKLEPNCSLHKYKQEQGLRLDRASLAHLDIVPLDVSPRARTEVAGLGNLSSLLPPAPPPPTPLEEAPQILQSSGSPEREHPCGNLSISLYVEQLKSTDNPGISRAHQGDKAALKQSEEQDSKKAAPEAKGPGVSSPTKDEISPPGEGDGAHSVQEPSDCDEDDTVTDVVQHGLEMVEPWEEPQWVTSPLHSPTLKEVQESRMQNPQSHRLERRLTPRPGLHQSHSLDSKSSISTCQWPLHTPSSSSCANLKTEKNFDSLQSPAARRELIGLDEKALRPFRDFSSLKGAEVLPSQRGPTDVQPKPAGTSPVSLAERKELGLHLGHSNPEVKQGDVAGLDSSKEESPAVQSSTSSIEHPPQLQQKNPDCGPSKGKNRPSSLNLDSAVPIADLFRLGNGASFSSPGMQLSEPEDPKVTWMTSSHCKADPWRVCSQDTQDLDVIAHAVTGRRRNSAPVSVSAVRTSFMIKMCQAKAVPVITPKIQYTQIPQPLPSQSAGESGAQPLEGTQEPPSSASGASQNPARDESSSPLDSPREEKPKQDTGVDKSSQMDLTASCMCEDPFPSPEPGLPNLVPTQDATVQCRKHTSETEPSGDNLLSSKLERPSGGSKPFHRARPGRPQSLILFSPPFPVMDHLPPSSTVTDPKVLLSPIRSPTQTVSPGLLCGELAENTWVTAEGVTLRNKMTIPKNGQRLETSTSCFYQPQRRSVILDGRSGRQIE